ncbi:hypothetical protein F7725_003054 [Dissostichus mawsoni]|uniref:Uncharacterized protein n=1 Tax=Dissostichus mawsoni TaxID=36200 RepID=A0A7J5Y941_DISMA|nr:hypothetical protein F7725_003054 [Dissostichus mawsoni]
MPTYCCITFWSRPSRCPNQELKPPPARASILRLQRNTELNIPEVKLKSVNITLQSSGSASSVDSVSNQNQRKAGEDVRFSTYRRLDSLEETIRELENTLIEISGHPMAEQLYTETTSQTKKPPVPPKPPSFSPASIQGANKVVQSSAASKLKHLQQNSTDKTKSGRREDFVKTQGQQQQANAGLIWQVQYLPHSSMVFAANQYMFFRKCKKKLVQKRAVGTNSTSGSIEPYLYGIKTGVLPGRAPSPAAVFTPGLRKPPQEGLPSLKGSTSQARALLASLSASGLSAEALLLSSTLRHRRLLREQRASSLPLPSSKSSPSTPIATSPSSSASPTTPTPSLSPSSPNPSLTLSSAVPQPSVNSCKEAGSGQVKQDLAPGS